MSAVRIDVDRDPLYEGFDVPVTTWEDHIAATCDTVADEIILMDFEDAVDENREDGDTYTPTVAELVDIHNFHLGLVA